MVGMLTAVGIVVGHGLREGIGHIAFAAASRVYMESKDVLLAGGFGARETADLSTDDHALVGLVKP